MVYSYCRLLDGLEWLRLGMWGMTGDGVFFFFFFYNTKQEYLGKFGSALYCSSVPYIFLVYINRVQTRTCIRALALGFGNKLVLWERKEVSIRSVPFMGKR